MQFSDLLKNQETLKDIEQISKESRDVQWGIWEQLDSDNKKILSAADLSIKVDHIIGNIIDEQTTKIVTYQMETKKILESISKTMDSIFKSMDSGSPKVTGSSIGKMQEFYKTVSTKVINEGDTNQTNTVANKNVSSLTNFATIAKNATTLTGFGVNPNDAKASMITPREEKLDATAAAESRDENIQMETESLELLKKIEENTRKPTQDGGGKDDKVKPKGFLDGLFDTMFGGLKSAFATLLSPGAILKSLAKLALPVMIIGAIANGLIDGFVEWQKTGDLKEALIKGFGGIVEFLSFGLFDAESIRALVENVGALYDEYIGKPIEGFIDSVTSVFTTISDFFTSAVDDFMGMIRSIGIPEMKFTIPLINKEVSIGPYYPFAEAEGGTKPTTGGEGSTGSPVAVPTPQPVEPVAANAVYNQSAQNNETAITNNSAAPTTVVAPTTVNNTKNERISFKNSTRNTDSSYSSLIQSRFVPT